MLGPEYFAGILPGAWADTERGSHDASRLTGPTLGGSEVDP
jgi:hypothetical protein